MTHWAIQAEGLSKSFGTVRAVDDVSLRVEQGLTLALVGLSGSGKSTTLRMLNRLIEPSAGRVLLAGEDVRSLEPHVLRRRIGYVCQGLGLFPHMSVEQNVGITPTLLGWRASDVRHRVGELLELVGLDAAGIGQRRPAELSGGQRQRVAVARALAARPSAVLLDEPFGALDAVTREGLQRSFRELQRELGFTAVLVTHDIVEACVIAARIAVLDQGRLAAQGTPAQLAGEPPGTLAARLFDAPLRHAESFLTATGVRS